MIKLLSLVSVTLLPTVGQAATYTETFNDLQNKTGWTFGRPQHFGPRDSGASDSFLYTDDLVDFSPFIGVKRQDGSSFTGNFKARRVKSISIDLNVMASEFPIYDRPLALELISDNETPNIPGDDWGVYTLSETTVSEAGSGWNTFKFNVPTSSSQLPANWHFIPYGALSPATPNWEKLRSNVVEVGFRIGDPALNYFIMNWKIGIDNPTIETE